MINIRITNRLIFFFSLISSILFLPVNLLSQNKGIKNKLTMSERHHQIIVRHAMDLLKIECPQIINTELYSYLGIDTDSDYGPWTTGKILAGAYREDHEDVIYEYSGDACVSCTHF